MKKDYLDDIAREITSPNQNFYQLRAKIKAIKKDLLQPNFLLHYAAIAKDEEIAGLLLDLGVNVNKLDRGGHTALHYAVQKSDPFTIQLLITKDALLLPDQNGNTPLHKAIENEDEQSVKLLCAIKGIDLNAKNIAGQSYLTLAAKCSNPQVLKLLLESYQNVINPQELFKLIEDDSQTLDIRYAAYRHLIARGKLEDLSRLASRMDFTSRDSEERDAMAIAIIMGREDVVAWLVARDHKFDVGDSSCCSVLLAIAYGHKQLFKKLISSIDTGGYDLSLNVKFEKRGPVNIAITYCQNELLEDLVTPVAKGGYGLAFDESSIGIAGESGQIELLKKLLKEKQYGGYGLGPVDRLTEEQITSLFGLAIRAHNYDFFVELMTSLRNGDFGIRCSIPREAKILLLTQAISFGAKRIFRYLTDPIDADGFGCDYHFFKNENFDPVSRALRSNSRLLVDLLKPTGFGGYGYSLAKFDPLDVIKLVVEFGHHSLLRQLVTPMEKGGYGLIINITNSASDLILAAIKNSQEVTLRELLKPIDQGGFGLTLNDPDLQRKAIDAAIEKRNPGLLKRLLTPKQDGGYGLLHLLYDVHFDSSPMGQVLFWHQFNYYLSISIKQVCDWVNKVKDWEIDPDYIKPILERYKELILFCYLTDKTIDAQLLVDSYENIKPHELECFLGKINEDTRNFENAFEHYLNCFKNKEDSNREKAGVEIVTMILTGNVVLKANGDLDKEATIARSKLPDTSIPLNQTQEEFRQLQLRAVMAYEYVYISKDKEALVLKERLEQILSGNGKPSFIIPVWQPQSIKAYIAYYSVKNDELLKAKAYCTSVVHRMDDAEKYEKLQIVEKKSEPVKTERKAATVFFDTKRSVVTAKHFYRVTANRLCI